LVIGRNASTNYQLPITDYFFLSILMNNLILSLDPDNTIPLYRQIYAQIREKILSGDLSAGTPLPASRTLAETYHIARVTVTTAYEQLQVEGFVTAQVGAGTCVAEQLPMPHEPAPFRPSFSKWGRGVASTVRIEQQTMMPRPEIDFGFGRSFPHIFPYDIWRRLLARYLSTDDTMLSRYGSVAGFDPLRSAVADYLRRMRGVNCTAEQVVIVSGIQQALDILARLLLEPGDEVLVETPGYPDALKLFQLHQAALTALPVDDEGFPVEKIPKYSQAKFAFVTPSNQFPSGGTMPLERRLALLQWAQEHKALVLEDDYDGELRYSDHPLAALQGLDNDGRVVYLGTFSKVLFPALRLGYVVLPSVLLAPFLQAKQLVDRGAPTLTQAAVADFITEGHFERHLRRLRKAYGRRRAVLVKALQTHLTGKGQYAHDEAGLHVMVYLNKAYDEGEVVRKAAEAGVGIYPGQSYHVRQAPGPSILLGFSGLDEKDIEEGIRRLANVLDQIMDKQ
jgi:GntR family transcriptional regulator/MocR family aminotransferase